MAYNQTTGDKLKTFVAYMPENARGSYSNITSNADKIPSKVESEGGSPVGLTYLLVDLDYETVDGMIENAKYKIYLGGDAAGDMNLLANTQYNVTTYLYGANTADTRITVTGIFNPTVKGNGSLNNKVKPLANSYIIDASSSKVDFVLPLVQARNGWRYVDNTLATKGETANYVETFDAITKNNQWSIVTEWKTLQNGSNVTGSVVTNSEITTASDNAEESVVQYAKGYKYYVKVSSSSTIANGNNYVIALKDNNGKIWWTWHLWFTDYNPDAADGSKKGQTHKYFSEAFTTAGLYYNKKMMDRNLGATIVGVNDATSWKVAGRSR